MADLDHEFALTTDGLDHAWIKSFQELGIPKRVLFGPRYHLGVGRIVTHSSGLFEFHVDGDPAIIVAEGEPEWPGWLELYDLIAFKLDDPSRWWLRRGAVDLLGSYNMTPWKLGTTTIHETPLSWLQAGATGICIFDWGFDPLSALLPAGDLVAETPALKARLERRITEAALEPFKITVASPANGSEARDAA
jgi:hypothetical protein